jgi:hypothetical protein
MVRRSAHHLVICEGKVAGICRHNRVIYAFGELLIRQKAALGFPLTKSGQKIQLKSRKRLINCDERS